MRIISVLAFVASLGVLRATAHAEEVKIAYVNMAQALNDVDDGKAAKEKLKKEIAKIKSAILTNKLKALIFKIIIKMGLDASYKTKVETKITQLKSDGIFVLPSGMLEDYLNEDGSIKSDTLKIELLAILKS